jgi:polyphosphate glucokinase
MMQFNFADLSLLWTGCAKFYPTGVSIVKKESKPASKTAKLSKKKSGATKTNSKNNSEGGKPKRKSSSKQKNPRRKTTEQTMNTIADIKPSELRVLSIDIGGTKAKMLLSGELEARKVKSGIEFTPLKFVEQVNELTKDWKYDVISIGFPGLVGANGPLAEPGNLGSGWMGFDFNSAFGKPVKFVNDAAMQAVGSYEGGRMLFLGLGTGVGSALIVDHCILPLELGSLRWDSRHTVGEILSKRNIKKIGLKKWRKAVHDFVVTLIHAFNADYVVVGGGNAKLVRALPAGARLGHNQTAFLGGFRVWGIDEYSKNAVSNGLPGDWSLL